MNAPEEEADELDQPSEEEMESINNIVSDTDIVKALRTQAESHASKLSKMHRKIESEMQSACARGMGLWAARLTRLCRQP